MKENRHEPAFVSQTTNESQLVRDVLQMLQGFSTSLFCWDDERQGFCARGGIYTTHLSQSSLYAILDRFVFAASCLKLVEIFVMKVEGTSSRATPTLRAFAGCVSMWLKRLRDFALKEEVNSVGSCTRRTPTLLGLANSLSSICSAAEYLLQIVHEVIPGSYFNSESSAPAGEFSAHILDHLCLKLNEVCLVQGGEEEAYHMLLAIFTETLLPYLDGLDSWIYDGTLDDPYEEMFFYANSAVSIDQPEFWEKSYLFRSFVHRKTSTNDFLSPGECEPTMQDKREIGDKESGLTSISLKDRGQNDADIVVCPFFLKDIARAIVSAGKSLQLVQHVWADGFSNEINYNQGMRLLTLSELFLISLVGLIGDGNHICEILTKPYLSSHEISKICKAYMEDHKLEQENSEEAPQRSFASWFRFMVDAILKKSGSVDIKREFIDKYEFGDGDCFGQIMKKRKDIVDTYSQKRLPNDVSEIEVTLTPVFYPENPVITISRDFLLKNKTFWDELNISKSLHLPPLNDESLRNTIYNERLTIPTTSSDQLTTGVFPRLDQTNFTLGFKSSQIEHVHLVDDRETLESLYPFPTFLPCFQGSPSMSELMPFQKNGTLTSKILNWIQNVKPKATLLPAVIIQECLIVYIHKQVNCIGKLILLKLMSDWKLMDELGVLRAIYLLGSGDLLQQFLIVIFDKLDKGDPLDDDFELNTILQESIRNSADGSVLGAPDSLVVSITKHNVPDDEDSPTGIISTPPCKIRNQGFGIDALDQLKFIYKVSWPLDLIINMEAIKKYNQVMGFLLKVKRAKFALDKARRWMWKCRGSMNQNRKHHLLVEQKLLHFVDAFHQYVMDRVFHSAWLELCNGMASAGSLDEVIEVHEAYLLSIQRQCFVAPDKLWALIASRVKIILGLALDFYTIQQTLISGGAAPAIKARCEMEVDRVEKKFDDCIAFLLRILSFKLNVGHFPHLADLVTRINYNYFYMSDNGNLLTIPSFETTGTK